jgi:hypothetical protein
MTNVSRTLRREWERVACAVAVVLLLVFLADWALRDQSVDSPSGSARIDETPSVLGPGAFAFLQDADPGSAPARNPFLSSAIEAPAARPERPPQPAAPKLPVPAPKPPPAVAPRPLPPEPAPTALAAPPAPRLGVCEVKYVFSTTNRSGRPVALIELQDPTRPGAAPLARNVSAGDLAYGLRIQSFTDQALTLVDAAGRRQTVSFGGTRRVSVDLGAAP